MYPHAIRLRGPWECEPLDPAAPPRRLALPCSWAGAGLAGSARVPLRRRFGYPGQIDAHERVWLTLAGLTGRVRVTLNGTEVGTVAGGGAYECEVTALLRPRNELTLEVEGGAEEGRPWGEVALEVRAK